MTVFDDLAANRLDLVRLAFDGDPGLAESQAPGGSSLLAWTYYAGRKEATGLVRSYIGTLAPHDAIIADEIDAVKRGLDAGWDGNSLSPDRFTPLGLAAFFNRQAIFDLLLPLTRDVNERAANDQQVAAIHAASAARSSLMVEKLLRTGADPNLPQHKGFRAIHTAAQHGDAPMTGVLLLFGADPKQTTDDGEDAAHFARKAGHDWLAIRFEALAR